MPTLIPLSLNELSTLIQVLTSLFLRQPTLIILFKITVLLPENSDHLTWAAFSIQLASF